MEKLSNCIKQWTLEILPDSLSSTKQLSTRVPSSYEESANRHRLEIDPSYNNYDRTALHRAIDLAG